MEPSLVDRVMENEIHLGSSDSASCCCARLRIVSGDKYKMTSLFSPFTCLGSIRSPIFRSFRLVLIVVVRQGSKFACGRCFEWRSFEDSCGISQWIGG